MARTTTHAGRAPPSCGGRTACCTSRTGGATPISWWHRCAGPGTLPRHSRRGPSRSSSPPSPTWRGNMTDGASGAAGGAPGHAGAGPRPSREQPEVCPRIRAGRHDGRGVQLPSHRCAHAGGVSRGIGRAGRIPRLVRRTEVRFRRVRRAVQSRVALAGRAPLRSVSSHAGPPKLDRVRSAGRLEHACRGARNALHRSRYLKEAIHVGISGREDAEYA